MLIEDSASYVCVAALAVMQTVSKINAEKGNAEKARRFDRDPAPRMSRTEVLHFLVHVDAKVKKNFSFVGFRVFKITLLFLEVYQ